MRLIACLILCAAVLQGPARAEVGREVISRLLRDADAVVSCEVVASGQFTFDERGVGIQACKIRVDRVVKGQPILGSVIDVEVVVPIDLDKTTKGAIGLKVGDQRTLFLRAAGGFKDHPQWKTADLWFGVQPASMWRELESLVEKSP